MAEQNPYVAPQSEPGPGGEEYLAETVNSPPLDEEGEESEELREPASYVYAGFLRRAGAKMIDAICFNLVFFIAIGFAAGIKAVVFTTDQTEVGEAQDAYELNGYVEPPETETGGEQWERIQAQKRNNPEGLSDTMFSCIGIAAFIVFAGLSEWLSGQSLGKLLFGIQVVDVGPPALPPVGMAIARNVGLLVDCIFFGLFAYVVMRTNPRNQRSGDIAAGTLVVLKSSIPGSPLSNSSTFMQGMLASGLSSIATAILLLMIDPTL